MDTRHLPRMTEPDRRIRTAKAISALSHADALALIADIVDVLDVPDWDSSTSSSAADLLTKALGWEPPDGEDLGSIGAEDCTADLLKRADVPTHNPSCDMGVDCTYPAGPAEEARQDRKLVVTITERELTLLLEALDAYEYWQLSDERYRDDGFVEDPGSDDPEAAAIILEERALYTRLESRIGVTPARST